MKPLNSKEVKAVIKKINDQFDIEAELNYYFFMNNKNRLYIVNKEYFNENMNVKHIGMYFAEYKNDEIRLSIEGAQLIYNFEPKKNVFEITDIENWLKGNDLEIEHEDTTFMIIKYKDDVLGSGKIKNNKLLNYIPKIRRLKSVFLTD